MDAALFPKKTRVDAWYKEPWLLLVAGGPLFVVCASLYTGYIALHGADKVVAEDYYRQGLMINKDIQRDARAKELQLSAVIVIDTLNNKLKMQISSKTSLPDTVQLSLANAAAGGNTVNEVIHRLSMKQVSMGNYEGDMKLLPNLSANSVKLFHLKLEGSDWRLTGDWFDPEQKSIRLSASK
ncbi:FixH family protein [Undibacterium sp. TJN19]|uniref:FixH family protein n=1 Tax=Undibacterium sp. TJN19 TaxID=3413055 RepID=UPI003BF1AFDD